MAHGRSLATRQDPDTTIDLTHVEGDCEHQHIRKMIREGRFDFVLSLPRVGSLSRACVGRVFGPDPARTALHPLGSRAVSGVHLRRLSEENQECEFAIQCVSDALSSKVPCLLLHPEHLGSVDGRAPATLWNFAEARALLDLPGAWTGAAFSCVLAGASTKKPIRVVSSLPSLKSAFRMGWPVFKDAELDRTYEGPLPRDCGCGREHEPLIFSGGKHPTLSTALMFVFMDAFLDSLFNSSPVREGVDCIGDSAIIDGGKSLEPRHALKLPIRPWEDAKSPASVALCSDLGTSLNCRPAGTIRPRDDVKRPAWVALGPDLGTSLNCRPDCTSIGPGSHASSEGVGRYVALAESPESVEDPRAFLANLRGKAVTKAHGTGPVLGYSNGTSWWPSSTTSSARSASPARSLPPPPLAASPSIRPSGLRRRHRQRDGGPGAGGDWR